MTKRRLALRSGEPLATFLFYSLILGFCFGAALQAHVNLAAMGDAGQTALIIVFTILLSAATLVFSRYHRRDYASPRRNGRRI
jgi:polyferredoxin